MNFLDKQFGRLGNRMFQMAALYAYAKELKVDYYFQDEKWFKKYADEIRLLFGENIGYHHRVSMHIRRTDMVNNNFDINLSETDYYDKAIALFPNYKFLIFSDDLDWCKQKFIGEKFEFSEGRTEEQDLKLMASCCHNIIANSSFSWWAAYLNLNPNKIVVCPNQNYLDGQIRRVNPKEWVVI